MSCMASVTGGTGNERSDSCTKRAASRCGFDRLGRRGTMCPPLRSTAGAAPSRNHRGARPLPGQRCDESLPGRREGGSVGTLISLSRTDGRFRPFNREPRCRRAARRRLRRRRCRVQSRCRRDVWMQDPIRRCTWCERSEMDTPPVWNIIYGPYGDPVIPSLPMPLPAPMPMLAPMPVLVFP